MFSLTFIDTKFGTDQRVVSYATREAMLSSPEMACTDRVTQASLLEDRFIYLEHTLVSLTLGAP